MKLNFSVQANAGSDEPAVISIRGVIGETFDWDNFTVKNTETEVLNALNDIPKGKAIRCEINSVGGNFGIGLGCFNALYSRYDDVTTVNTGFACSAASCVMLAGKNRISPTSCAWMIHCGSTMTVGNAKDHEGSITMLQTMDKTMAAMYAKAAGGTADEWMERMKAETWYTGDEACEAGLGTAGDEDFGDTPEIEMTADAKRIVATFKKTPTNLQSRFKAVTAQAENPPQPTTKTPTKISMKKTITALVALGITCAENASDETVAELVTSNLTSVRADRDKYKTDCEAHVTARKTRVTAAVEKAVTDKVVAEGRKASMISIGSASDEGEALVMDQIADLRGASATARPRGAAPVPRGNGEGEETIETLLEDQAEATENNDGPRLAEINAKLREKRGRGDVIKPYAMIPAFPRN